MSVTLDRDAFRAWLAGQEPDSKVGEGQWASDCPIACYARQLEPRFVAATAHDEYVRVYTREWDVFTGRPRAARRIPTPTWAREFIHRVDHQFGMWASVTAAAALAILDAIPEEATT